MVLYQSLLHRVAYDNGNMYEIIATKGLNAMAMSK
jgi:hypothetical protein